MHEPKANKPIDSTRDSPTPSYSSDSIEDYADGSFSTSSLRRTLETMSVETFGEESERSQSSESFESIDDLLFLELIEPPPTEIDCTGDVPLPKVGKHWKDLNNFGQSEEEELEDTDAVEPNRDDQEGREEPMKVCPTNEEILQYVLGEFIRDQKTFKPYSKILWEKIKHLTGKGSSAMFSQFRTKINPMIPSLTLPADFHMEFMKSAKTVIEDNVKIDLEARHQLRIVLNTNRQIESWTKEERAPLVIYSDTSSSEEN